MKLPSLSLSDEPSEMGGVLIPLPNGFKSPKKDGEEFEIMVKAHKMGDKLHLLSADGFEFASEPQPEMETEEPEQAMETEEETGEESEKTYADEDSDEEANETFRETGGEEDDEGEGLMASIRKFRQKMHA